MKQAGHVQLAETGEMLYVSDSYIISRCNGLCIDFDFCDKNKYEIGFNIYYWSIDAAWSFDSIYDLHHDWILIESKLTGSDSPQNEY